MASSGSPSATDHAIVIGIERYLDGDVAPLKGARSDARRFHAWVTSRNGGAVRRKNALLFAPARPRSRDATIDELRRAFIKLGSRAKGKGYIGRRLYVYLAGHGIAQNRDEVSLFAADGGPGALDRHIPGWCYASWFMYSAYFDEVILFADCCRTAHRDLPVQPFPLSEVDSPSAGDARYVKAFAVRYGQSALEIGAERSAGAFTDALLDALRCAFQDGEVTAETVAKHLHNHPKLKALRAHQEPSFVWEGDVVFATRDPAHPPTTRVRLYLQGDGVPTVEGGPRPPSRGWPVRPGRRARRYRQYLVNLPAGLYAARVRGRTQCFEVSGKGPTDVRLQD